MKQTMKWLFVEIQGDSAVFRCSVCNSEISVKQGEELPYCKHCESEPDGEQFAKKKTQFDRLKEMSVEKFAKESFVILGHGCKENYTDECPSKEWKNGLTPCEQCLVKYLESEVQDE